MVLITTFSPTNIENQLRALNSWKSLGIRVLSFNSKYDIEKLSQVFDVEFVEVENTGKQEYGKDYIYINTFTDWVKHNGDAFLINSDIEILETVTIEPKENTLQVFSRNDYVHTHKFSRHFESGFDGFYITKQFSYLVPKSKLVLGQCHWDYFLPLIAIKNGYELQTIRRNILFHKKHDIQYNNEKWTYTGKVFAEELGLSGNVAKDSKDSFNLIKSKLVYG